MAFNRMKPESVLRFSLVLIKYLLLLSSSLPVFSQSTEPTAIDAHQSDINPLYAINQYLQVLKTTRSIAPDSVLFHASEFENLSVEPVMFYGYDDLYYWYRFKVNNNTNSEKDLRLLMGQLGIRHGELYTLKDSSLIQEAIFGYMYPFETRPYILSHHALPLKIPPSSSHTFYLRVDESHAFKVAAFALFSASNMKLAEGKFYLSFGIIIGAMLLFFLFNIYLYVTTRKKIHFWYAIYIVAQTFLIIKHEGLDAQFLGLDSEIGYRSTSMLGVGAVSIGLLIHVLQLFFTNIPREHWIQRTARFLKIFIFIGALIQFYIFFIQPDILTEKIVFHIVSKSLHLSAPLIFILCIISYRKGYKPALFVLAGLLAYVLTSNVRILFLSDASYLFPPSYFELGIVSETIIISFGLMYQYHLDQLEKIKLAEELKTNSLLTNNLELQLNEAQLTAMRAQMNPHFVFNSINAIQNLILKENKTEAITYLNDFSKLARHTLNNASKEHHTVKEETVFLEKYLKLEQLRSDFLFNYQILVDDKVDPDYDKVPTMAIQPFVENAILHGLRPKGKNGVLTIQFTNFDENTLLVIVHDNGIGRKASEALKQSKNHTSIAMDLTQHRMKLLERQTDQKYQFEVVDQTDEGGRATGTKVTITIPLILSKKTVS